MLKIGLQYETELTVGQQQTAKVMGSGELDVFSTPVMVALMEEAAWRCVASELEEGQGTVGTSMNVQHISSTPVGMKVTAKAILVEINGRELVFSIEANDEKSLIGKALHSRAIINNEKFFAKTQSKLAE